MIIFLIVFLSLYGGMHFYAFVKVMRAFTFVTPVMAVLAGFMIVMILTPVLVHVTEMYGFEAVARGLAWIGYMWMGFIFLFICSGFMLDFYRLVLVMGERVLAVDLSGAVLSYKTSFIICFSLSTFIMIYGFFEAGNIKTEYVTVHTQKIPEAVGRLRIVQISDVHLGLIVGEKRLEKIIRQVNLAKPDIFISTGDLVDGQMDNLSRLSGMLRDVHATYGKFAVTGNHEYYAGIKRSLKFTEDAGFKVLHNEGTDVGGMITIAGVDDAAISYYNPVKRGPEKIFLAPFSRDRFILLLKHRPLIDKTATGFFDLQLSGHTHGGQIFPFNFLTMVQYYRCGGLLNIEKNSFLYASRGSGTWGPPVRFLSPPEVTAIDLVYRKP